MEVPPRFELGNESFADSCLTTWPRYHMKLGTPSVPNSLSGAGDEARTRYLHLGKVALYRMSYTRILVPEWEPWCRPSESKSFDSRLCEKWCLRSESNQRHVDFQSTALPTELQRHIVQSKRSAQMHYLATRNGLEPSTSSVTGWRANRLHHRARWWWEQQGSNL